MIRTISWPTIIPEVVSIASGILLSYAFPPHGEPALAWFALVPFWMAVHGVEARRGFRLGFLCGLGFWLFSISWFWALIGNGGPWFVVLLGHLALSAYCALYVGVCGWLGARKGILLTSAWKDLVRAIGLSLAWVGLEWVRSNLLTGFAWNHLGVSQYRSLAIIQLASIGGVYAISFCVQLINVVLSHVGLRFYQQFRRHATPRHHPDLILACLFLLIAFFWGLRSQSAWHARESEVAPFRVAGVQPNAPAIFERDERSIHATFQRLTERTQIVAKLAPHLVVWPETVLLGGIPDAIDSIDYAMRHAREAKAPVLAGAVEVRESDDPEKLPFVANVSCRFEPGHAIQFYRKQHLVPFGEYIPLDSIFPILERLSPTGVSCTAGTNAVLFAISDRDSPEAAPIHVSPLICFEDTVPPLASKAVRCGAQVLINQTNDSWFEGSREPMQHQAQAIFRAIETRTPLVRVSNGGISGTISATGIQSAPATYFCQTLAPRQPHWPLPLYARLGDWILAIPAAIGTVLLSLKRLLSR